MPTKAPQSETQNIPKLRFPGFSGGWEEKKLTKLTKIYDGTHQTPTYIKEGVPFYSVEHLTANDFTETKFVSREVFEKENKKVKLEKGDILMTRIGDIGTARLIDWEVSASFYVSLALIKQSDKFYSKFLAQYINSSNFQKELWKKTIHVAFPKKINLGEIGECILFLPKIVEQQKIADFLESTDELINNLKEQKENLESYKKGMMQKIFSQEIRFKDEKGKEFQRWIEGKLGNIGDIVGGGTPDTTKEKYWNGEINWFTPTEIKSKYAKQSLRKITDMGLKNSSAKLLPVGTILFTSRATVGDLSISTIECSTNQGFQSIITNNQNSNEFIYYWVIKNKNEFLRKANGSTFLEVSSKEMKKMKCLIPSLPEQQKIADFLTSIDKVIESKQQQISEAKQWKKGLMQGLFV